MGTGSSRASTQARRSHSPAKHWRGSRRGSGISSAPAGQRRPEESDEGSAGAAMAEARCSSHQASLRAPSPAEPDSDLELLDQVLEECRGCCCYGDDDDGGDSERLIMRLPGGRPPRFAAGDSWPQPAGGAGEQGEIPREQQVFLPRCTPENSNFAKQLPLKKPERQAKIAYDYSEEELMATIEQEYCR